MRTMIACTITAIGQVSGRIKQLRDELFYNQVIQAYMTMLPALNTIGMRDGSEKALGAGYNVLPM